MLSAESPFPNDRSMVNCIVHAQYDFDSEAFDDVSSEAKNLISMLMQKDPKDRISAADALHHVWFQSFFPDRNKPVAARQVAGALSMTRAFDEAEDFDGFGDEVF